MNRKIQLLISFIILFGCISTIVYNIYLRREDAGKTYKEVNTSIPEDKNVENTGVYDVFLKNFNCHGEEYYYSFINLAGYDYPILLLSNGVYKFNDESKVALWTDIYYPVNNEVIKFGNISSDGTAYPISANTTGIYTAGGHEVTKYGLDIPNRELKLISKFIIFFHKVGKEVNSITVRITGNENKIVSEEELNKAFEEYGNADIIYFKRLC